MFNYTKEIIVNNINNVIADSTNKELIIKRGGNYKKANIVGSTINKTVGVAGSVATVAITVGTALTAGNIYRFSMFVSTPNKELADYAYPNWGEFGKAVLVEFAGKGAVADDAAALAEALKLSLQPDNELFGVSVASDTVTLTFKDAWAHVAEINFDEFDSLTEEFVAATNLGTPVITNNVEPFATAEWIVENLRFPSYPNRRYAALFSDEAPVAGKKYNQYTFEYKVQRAVPGGLSGVGQVVDSITSHVIYVNEDIVSTFETRLNSAFDNPTINVIS